jgi:hypothetical protein
MWSPLAFRKRNRFLAQQISHEGVTRSAASVPHLPSRQNTTPASPDIEITLIAALLRHVPHSAPRFGMFENLAIPDSIRLRGSHTLRCVDCPALGISSALASILGGLVENRLSLWQPLVVAVRSSGMPSRSEMAWVCRDQRKLQKRATRGAECGLQRG